MALHWKILIAIALAAPFGVLASGGTSFLGVTLLSIYDFVGTLFLNALKMVAIPLVLGSIISGVASLSGRKNFGRLGVRTLGYYLLTSLLAILMGLMLVNLLKPGYLEGKPAKDAIGLSAETDRVTTQVGERGGKDIVELFLRMVPPNIFQAAAEGQMLGLITFALLYGFFAGRLKPPVRGKHLSFWEGFFSVMMALVGFILKFAPFGVFALVAKVVATTGFGAVRPLAWFALTVLLGLGLHAFVTLPLLMRFMARVPFRPHLRAVSPALLTAFSTASSSATLPLTIECVEKRAKVSNEVSGFVLPLGATVNMDGTALYECVAVMFIAQAYGVELSFAAQFAVVWLALMTSIGVAGVPAASLVAIVIILRAVGLPLEGIGLILAVDRLLDMLRTGVNVWSDTCGAAVMDRWLRGNKRAG